jgi:hypothetical protein
MVQPPLSFCSLRLVPHVWIPESASRNVRARENQEKVESAIAAIQREKSSAAVFTDGRDNSPAMTRLGWSDAPDKAT